MEKSDENEPTEQEINEANIDSFLQGFSTFDEELKNPIKLVATPTLVNARVRVTEIITS
jgi:hypothetical protein